MVDKCLIEFLCNTEPGRFFPATDLYNEGWMLRLILDWFDRNRQLNYMLRFNNGSEWYSEALLPSAFLPRSRGDKLGENRTHADGVIGHIDIRQNTKAGLELKNNASQFQFVVIEAKMFSGLSERTKNASYFDQASRTVACMAEVVKRAGICPSQFQNIAFYVVAPESQIKKDIFSKFMKKSHIECTVKKRVSKYQDPKQDKWLKDYFLPIFQKTETDVISWEDILDFISGKKYANGKALNEFYKKCREFNKQAAKK